VLLCVHDIGETGLVLCVGRRVCARVLIRSGGVDVAR
jgi:hypothetical protein